MLTPRTAILLGALALLAGAVAWATLGAAGAAAAIAASLLVSTAAYWGRSRATLRMLGGRPLQWYEAPELHGLVESLARRAGLPAPRLFLVPGGQLNAMAVATARSSAIGVTAPLLEHLTANEIAAVIAHEISHIRHKDLVLAMAAGGLAGAAALLAELGRWGIIFAWLMGLPVHLADVLMALLVAGGVPVAALMLRMAISREREFLADRGAAGLIGSPELLATALYRLDRINRGAWWHRLLGWAPPVEASGPGNLFLSHPPIKERIARLRAMGGDRVRLLGYRPVFHPFLW